MNVWELRCANINDYAMVVPSELDLLDGLFEIDGRPLDWKSIPIVDYADSRSRGKHKRPVADVATIGPGAFVLSRRAFDVLGAFLGQFGQLLEVQTAGGGEFRHLYNVTNLVKCVDAERSAKSASGAVSSEVFYDLNVPRGPAVFKDPLTAAVRLYTNDPGRELIERLSADNGLTGIECGVPRGY
ncbi:hypothetical protein [Scleromatobacter humisilvae]|uniref:Uncharacterized protein n=1 Tax=Scleromatobacter humisilvae TaxID=2897159 RepID=A0A9X1YIB1_9BURK|nr:hypothetical protein [Scleromatobacter humisilvae]MCK9684907.1 hypothetical protein [Scleromatobacter humisilvae]